MSPRLVELFAGTRSVGSAAEARGWEVWSTDLYAFEGIAHQADIMELEPSAVPFVPDAVWASPPCTYLTVMSIGRHWTPPPEHAPKTEQARQAVRIVERTLELIRAWEAMNPRLVWYMENPRAKLRKLAPTLHLPRRVTVTYCQYGDTRQKPTDIWTNDLNWNPRPACRPKAPCHTPAPRGSRAEGTTQGLMSATDRGRIPRELCLEILESAEDYISRGSTL